MWAQMQLGAPQLWLPESRWDLEISWDQNWSPDKRSISWEKTAVLGGGHYGIMVSRLSIPCPPQDLFPNLQGFPRQGLPTITIAPGHTWDMPVTQTHTHTADIPANALIREHSKSLAVAVVSSQGRW